MLNNKLTIWTSPTNSLLRPSCNPSEDVVGTIATDDVVSAADDDFFALIFKQAIA